MNKKQDLWRDLPLGSKLAALTSLLVVLVVLALTFVSIQREQASFRQELEDQATLLLDTLPLTMRDSLYRLEIDEMRDTAEVVSENDSVNFLLVYDREGMLLVQSDNMDTLDPVEFEPLVEDLLDSGSETSILDWQPEQLVAGRALFLGNQPVGVVTIGLSTEDLQDKVTALTYQNILIAVIALVTGVALAFLLARQVTSPLGTLADVAGRMSEGNYETRVELESGDELGQLGKSFNKMAQAIEKRDFELRELTAGLELAVKQRTVELREQNEALLQVNEDLAIARARAEDATQLKDQFLASMSHELRTPLNAIIGFSDLLMAGAFGDLNQKQSDRIERILKSGNRLLEMINDLLDLSKIGAGRMELVEKPFYVREWLDEITGLMEDLAKEKGLEFEVTLDQDLPHSMVSDASRLRQVAINLVSNAIKFTDKGKVSIDIKRLSASQWQIKVQDTGIGIPDDALPVIFEEFRRVEKERYLATEGTGLGLAIVKKLVEMLDGDIKVESEIGKGSTFTAILPIVTEAK